MFPERRRFDDQTGWTLVELLVVISVIAIVASMALMQRGTTNERLQRQNASRELKVAFERARFDSVKRRADGTGSRPYAYVEVRSNGFTLRTYNDDVNANPVARDQSLTFPSGVVLTHYSSGTIPMTVTFNRRGETAGGVPQFRVCNVSCASPTNATAETILVTPMGTVNLLAGNANIPSFTNTALAGSTSNTASINDDVIIP